LLAAIIDPTTRLGEVRIALKPDPALRPGAFARGEITVGSERRPVVPQTAVLSDSKGVYVVIVGPDGRVARRSVRVSRTAARGVVIAEGLAGDERVVTTAGAFLREGEQVTVAKPAPADAAKGA
jgi:multidrug efflux pump subunit AcrA (membrane-fusion protein)